MPHGPPVGPSCSQVTVLYLGVEDDHRRLQGRLYRTPGTEAPDNLLFAVYAKQLGVGLEEQLKKFVQTPEHQADYH